MIGIKHDSMIGLVMFLGYIFGNFHIQILLVIGMVSTTDYIALMLRAIGAKSVAKPYITVDWVMIKGHVTHEIDTKRRIWVRRNSSVSKIRSSEDHHKNPKCRWSHN